MKEKTRRKIVDVLEWPFWFFFAMFWGCLLADIIIACITEDRSHTQMVWLGYMTFAGIMSFLIAGILQQASRIISDDYFYE